MTALNAFSRILMVTTAVVAAAATQWVIAGEDPDVAGMSTNASLLSPVALAVTQDGRSLFVGCATANKVLRLDLQSRRIISTLPVPAPPLGMAISPDGARLFVTCAADQSVVCAIDLSSGAIVARIKAGHTAMSPAVSSDGRLLFVCNRFNHDVSVIDLEAQAELRRIPVRREPVAAALSSDGKYLLVANALPTGRANVRSISAVVSVINVADGSIVRDLRLPNGSTSLNDLRVSPDGKYAAVSHLVSRFHLPAETVERGWMNVNALTLIDLRGLQILNTVLLDQPRSGAANPWGIAWSSDHATLAVTHAGTHEISLIDFPVLIAKLRALPDALDTPRPPDFGPAARLQSEVSNDFTFLAGLRRRVQLPEADRGPRAVALFDGTAYVANYFSDTLVAVAVTQTNAPVVSIPLGPQAEVTAARKGELHFHDATLCYQGWQSCASCHPGDARMDGLNWDLLNDDRGNPKSTKSLLLAHQTPPSMSLGVRDTAETAVRAGIEHVLFTRQPEEVPAAIDEYLKSLKPVPSPYLVEGKLSSAAQRGQRIFEHAGCADCHPHGRYTDLRPYDVGTRARGDQPDDEFDTPALVELWRTAPYLHDGSAATIREVVTSRNPQDQHGSTSKLTRQEIDDLCAFLLSL